MCVPSFKAGNDDPVRESHKRFYLQLLETKDFNALIEYKPFFDQSVKKRNKLIENKSKCKHNYNYYTMQKLLDYFYHQKY